jgi:hypothetical protein
MDEQRMERWWMGRDRALLPLEARAASSSFDAIKRSGTMKVNILSILFTNSDA